MEAVLKLKHWQLFGLLILYISLLAIILNFSQVQTPWALDIILFNVIPILGYPLLLTHVLDKYLDLSKGKSIVGLKSFDLDWLLFVSLPFISEVLFARQGIMDAEATSIEDTVLRILGGCLMLYLTYRFYKVSSKALKSIELKRDAGFWEYVADAFQIFAWPLCIWWIQPRINDAIENLQEKSLPTN